MGGVDHADQMIGLYDLDRKSQKWWRKVFFDCCLLLCIISTSFFVKPIKKIPYIEFFVKVAESMIEEGRNKVGTRKKAFSVFQENGCSGPSGHLPLKIKSRRRCIRCTSRKVEKRTNYLCQRCNAPLCMDCFSAYNS